MIERFKLRERDKVVYLYIHEWKYKEKDESNKFYGHPMENRVYQAIKNTDTYRIPLKSTNNALSGILITELESNDNPKWAYKVEEITEDNILELGINTEDIIKIGEWEDSGSSNIRHLTDEVLDEQIESERIDLDEKEDEEDMNSVSGAEPNGSDDFSEINNMLHNYAYNYSSNVILNNDKDKFKALAILITYLGKKIEEFQLKGHNLDIMSEIGMHEDYGKGALMFSAIKELENYLNEDKGTDGTVHLLEAIDYILYELIRTKIKIDTK